MVNVRVGEDDLLNVARQIQRFQIMLGERALFWIGFRPCLMCEGPYIQPYRRRSAYGSHSLLAHYSPSHP